MNEPRRDRLDAAIDAVAGRLTAVNQDTGLARRIVEALPPRSAWSLHWLLPRLAITVGLVAVTVTVVLRMFDNGSRVVLRTENSPVPTPVVEPVSNDRRTLVELAVIIRKTIVERPLNVRRTIGEAERPDHERSLAAIVAPEALAVEFLSPEELPAEDSLTIAPLAIDDLALTESFPPR